MHHAPLRLPHPPAETVRARPARPPARARQREIARVLVAAGAVNVVLSVALAETVGIWGVALSTLVTDLAVLAYVVPALLAPAAPEPGAATSLREAVRGIERAR